jgi:hypothetical protein
MKKLSIFLFLCLLAAAAAAAPFGGSMLLTSGGALSPQPFAADNSSYVSFYTSNNAANIWTSQTGVVGCDGPIAWNGTTYAAINHSSFGTIACSSPDGSTWTSQTLASAVGGPMAYGNGIFCAQDGIFGNGTTNSNKSSNGATWTSETGPNTNLSAIGFDGANFVASASGSTTVYTSSDCATWTPHTGVLPGTSTWTAMAWNGHIFVMISTNSGSHGVAYGTETSWTGANPGVSTLYDIAYGNGIFCAVGGNGTTDSYAYSSTGSSWTTGTIASSHAVWKSIKFNGSVFAVADSQGVIPEFYTSPNCSTWTVQGSGSPGGNVLFHGISTQYLAFGTY